jgi:Putative beta-barrel porin-2, OmpL-like. bbp2
MPRFLKYLNLMVWGIAPLLLTAQTDSSSLVISGYVEAYYCYDHSEPTSNVRPAFLYSHNRHNEVNLNLGYIKASFSQKNTRANLALMAGTYANSNLSSEPGVLKNVYEANAGILLHKSGNTWLDAGIFPSHIGFESAVTKDCWNATHSLIAENSPYYETGVKISHTSKNQKWFLNLLYLNGWQHIQRPEGNSTPAFGHQATYKPNAKITLNSSSFVGSDFPDSSRRMRYYHDFFGIFQLTQKLGMIVGLDFGFQQIAKNSKEYQFWHSPAIIARYAVNPKLAVAGRWENYNDKKDLIIATGTPNGFQTHGFSINVDFSVTPNAVLRLEARSLISKDPIFIHKGNAVNNNNFITGVMAVSF